MSERIRRLANITDLMHDIPDWRISKGTGSCLKSYMGDPGIFPPAHLKTNELYDPEMGLLGIRNIPLVLQNKLRWPKSAELMEKWFCLPGRAMTQVEKDQSSSLSSFPADYIDTTMFTWSWLKRFERVNQAADTLLGNLETPRAKAQIIHSLKANLNKSTGLLGDRQIRQQRTPDVVKLHQHDQFQLQGVGYQAGRVDDLYGSLGRFSLYAAISKVDMTVASGRVSATLKEVFLYMKDTYEFLGNQYLGHWNKDGLGMNVVATGGNFADEEWKWSAYNPSVGWMKPVGNADYRRYRDLTGMGGDLYLFSDLRPEPVNISVEFVL